MEIVQTAPYSSKEMNMVYEMLFSDRPEIFKRQQAAAPSYTWKVLMSDNSSDADLQNIAEDELIESRLRLLACRLLQERGITLPKELLGVVVEVGLENGLDTLAAYKDGTARYINFTEKMIVWETNTPQSNLLINNLFQHSNEVVKRIGPWEKKRLGPPPVNSIRLSFLVTDGLYFGQGPFNDLRNDPMAAPVIDAATELLVFLTERG